MGPLLGVPGGGLAGHDPACTRVLQAWETRDSCFYREIEAVGRLPWLRDRELGV